MPFIVTITTLFDTYPSIPRFLKETIFKIISILVILIVFVIVPVEFHLKFACLLFGTFVTFSRLLRLSFDFSFGRLHQIIFDYIASLDNVGDSSIIQDILAFSNDFLQKCSSEVDFSMGLKYMQNVRKWPPTKTLTSDFLWYKSNVLQPCHWNSFAPNVLTFIQVATFLACFK